MSVENIIKTGQFQGTKIDLSELLRRLELFEKDVKTQVDALITREDSLEATLATKADKGTVS